MKRYFVYAPYGASIDRHNWHPVFEFVDEDWVGVWVHPDNRSQRAATDEDIDYFIDSSAYHEVNEEVHRFVTTILFASSSDVHDQFIELWQDTVFLDILSGAPSPERYLRSLPKTKHKLGVPKGVLP